MTVYEYQVFSPSPTKPRLNRGHYPFLEFIHTKRMLPSIVIRTQVSCHLSRTPRSKCYIGNRLVKNGVGDYGVTVIIDGGSNNVIRGSTGG